MADSTPVSRDIPFDTPENTVKNIMLILKEEADQLGATVSRKTERKDITVNWNVEVTRGSTNFRLILTYIESQNLELARSSIGNGFIFSDQEDWKLELLPKDIKWAPLSSPFRWGLYSPTGNGRYVDYQHNPPSFYLDGTLLRRLLRNSLSSQPPLSP